MTHIISVTSALYRADKRGILKDDLSGLMQSGKVMGNENQLYKVNLDIQVRSKDALNHFTDYVVPILTLRHASGKVEDERLGVFVVPPYDLDHTARSSTSRIVARDLLFDLETNHITATLNFTRTDILIQNRIIGQLSAAGFPASRLVLSPPINRGITTRMDFLPGTSRLKIINELLAAAGYYHLWVDRFGFFRSSPYNDHTAINPAVSLFTGKGGNVVGAVEERPDWSRFGNKVTVRKVNPGHPTLYSTKVNTDPASPSSIGRLGRTYARPPVDDPNLLDQATADAKARALLAESGSFYRRVNVRSIPLPGSLGFHDAVDFDLVRKDEPIIDGRWRRTGWEIGLEARDGAMLHRLARAERFVG